MLKKKIYVVFTGGTIGSSVQSGAVDLDGSTASLLIAKYREMYGNGISFEEFRPVSLLSENIRVEDLGKMVACVRGLDLSDCDGIILTHGTDTLSFTANYFSQILCDLPVPLVLVSALYPLEDARSNGLENFAGAIMLIESGIKGIFVSYRNPGEATCKIHLASRILETEAFFGGMNSLGGVHFGEIREGKFLRNEDPRNPLPEALAKGGTPAEPALCTDVLTIRARALLDFSLYEFSEKKPKAVLLELYHSGTVCTQGEATDFLGFCKRCRAAGVPVVVSPLDSSAFLYASASELAEYCILARDVGFGMTIVKVMLALGAGRPIERTLEENLAFEKLI